VKKPLVALARGALLVWVVHPEKVLGEYRAFIVLADHVGRAAPGDALHPTALAHARSGAGRALVLLVAPAGGAPEVRHDADGAGVVVAAIAVPTVEAAATEVVAAAAVCVEPDDHDVRSDPVDLLLDPLGDLAQSPGLDGRGGEGERDDEDRGDGDELLHSKLLSAGFLRRATTRTFGRCRGFCQYTLFRTMYPSKK
jgi:hypothetical protein